MTPARVYPSVGAVQRAVVACERCRRLRSYCRQVARERKREFRDQTYWGRPVPGFGDRNARLLVVGLAPAAHGGNRTGRMFTGDSSGDWLYEALHRFGFASQPGSVARDDGLALDDCYVSAAVRCAPPGNRPSPSETAACRPYLAAEIALLARVEVVVTLGHFAHAAWLAASGWAARLAPGRRGPERRDAVVPSALVVVLRGRPFARLDDQAVLEHALDRAVERARAQANRPARALGDVLDDRVAVAVLAGEREQDVEDGRLEREEGLRFACGIIHPVE
ncbi:MAG TPA: uracil-DNA glycosylase, partial [Gemmatimonadales bacterium]|nr:uracil-DNA glycosylase [Gemmatimonadales bacterium]